MLLYCPHRIQEGKQPQHKKHDQHQHGIAYAAGNIFQKTKRQQPDHESDFFGNGIKAEERGGVPGLG